MIEDITNLIIEEFLKREKPKKRRDSEAGIPLELPLPDFPYWPEIPAEKEPDDESDEDDIYKKSDGVIIIQMNSCNSYL